MQKRPAPLRMPYLKKQKRLKEMGQNNQREQKKIQNFLSGFTFRNVNAIFVHRLKSYIFSSFRKIEKEWNEAQIYLNEA